MDESCFLQTRGHAKLAPLIVSNGPPTVLYKYCSEDSIAVLQTNSLKIAPPNELNDPFEFRGVALGEITAEDIQLAHTDPELCKRWALDQWNDLTAEKRRAAFDSFARKLNRDFKTRIATHDDEASRKHGLLCLSARPDSVLMWSHYASNHRGFVVGIEHRLLGDLRIFDVRYEEKRVSIPAKAYLRSHRPKNYWKDVFQHKAPGWSYEQEWRAMFSLNDSFLKSQGITNQRGENKTIRTLPLGSSIKVVFLGVRTKPELERQIRDALRQHHNSTEPRRFGLHHEHYALT